MNARKKTLKSTKKSYTLGFFKFFWSNSIFLMLLLLLLLLLRCCSIGMEKWEKISEKNVNPPVLSQKNILFFNNWHHNEFRENISAHNFFTSSVYFFLRSFLSSIVWYNPWINSISNGEEWKNGYYCPKWVFLKKHLICELNFWQEYNFSFIMAKGKAFCCWRINCIGNQLSYT